MQQVENFELFTTDNGEPMLRCTNCGAEYKDTAKSVLREITPMVKSVTTDDEGCRYYNLACNQCGKPFRQNIPALDLIEAKKE